MADLLIHEGADVEATNKSGTSLLILAVDKENAKIGKLLVQQGANIMSPNLPDKVVLEGIPPTLLLQWAFHGRGGYTAPDAFAMVRRHVASICDRSFDLISILGKIGFGPNFYIGRSLVFSEIDVLRLI